MTCSQNHMRLLHLLSEDCRLPLDTIADMLGVAKDEATRMVAELEESGVIVGYPAMINWEATEKETVQAVIEVKVTPQRDMGFDALAQRVYRFDEVRSVYLMSGAYDLMLEVEARTLKELASFVSQRLSTMEHVLSTATHFVLKKYKVDGHILQASQADNRLVVSP